MKVYVTRRLPGEALKELSLEHEVIVNEEDRNLTKQELKNNAAHADALICLLSDTVDKEVLDNANKLKVVANYAVGFNNIDVKEAHKKGIIVTNTPDVLTDTTADLAFALMLSCGRRIVESHLYTLRGEFKEWKPSLFLGHDITGATLGILGAGRIGKALGKRAVGFNMKILYHNRKRDLDFENETGAEYVSFEELLKNSDFLSLHVPLNDETRHIISYKELCTMKNSSIIINTGRGPLIDEKALIKALKEGKISGAGLDVYEFEPKISQELLSISNVVLTSHIGSASIRTREKMAQMACKNVSSVLKGLGAINEVK